MDFLFKNLIVWQKAMELTRKVYGLVKQLPAEERFALGDQLRRAVVSIPLSTFTYFLHLSPSP